MTQLIDIGVNLTNNRFADDRKHVVERALESGVSKLIITGTSIAETESALMLCEEFAEEYPGVCQATAGVHPHHAHELDKAAIANLRGLTRETAVVAVGETGLDFNRDFSPRDVQERAFEVQLELAAEARKPLFMHERDAAPRQTEIIRSYRDHLADGVIHCFTGDKKALFNYLDMNLYIGITGWICDERRGLELQRLVKNIPLDRLMIETDAPYLLPRNMQTPPKSRRNEPAFLTWVLDGIALHRPESREQIAETTTENARRFFGLETANKQHD